MCILKGVSIKVKIENPSNSTNLEFKDYEDITIILSDYYYQHIITERGADFTKYHKNWVETLAKPDYTAFSKSHKDCKLYIQVNNYKRKFSAKYLIVVVNEVNLITSIRFGRNLNFAQKIEKKIWKR